MQDNSVALADSAAEQYASVMDGLIADCSRLEDRVAELENSLQAAVRERDAAAAERAMQCNVRLYLLYFNNKC